MRDFDLLQPATLDDALALLAQHGEDACIYAGGTALLLGMRQRLLSPPVVVSLGRLADLRAIRFDPQQGLSIGAGARHAEVARSAVVRQHYPMLAGMAGGLANPQVRNQGTIGGNLCYADPSTDPPACLIALGASVVLAGPGGRRQLALEDFLTDYFTTALEPGEILVEIRIAPPRADETGAYLRHLRTAAEHRPVANIAVMLRRSSSVCTAMRLIVGAATPIPQRMARAEALAMGQAVTPELASQIAAAVAEDLNPISDSRGDGEFRRTVVRVIARRVVLQAAGLDWKDNAA